MSFRPLWYLIWYTCDREGLRFPCTRYVLKCAAFLTLQTHPKAMICGRLKCMYHYVHAPPLASLHTSHVERHAFLWGNRENKRVCSWCATTLNMYYVLTVCTVCTLSICIHPLSPQLVSYLPPPGVWATAYQLLSSPSLHVGHTPYVTLSRRVVFRDVQKGRHCVLMYA